jgi:hypothetical protein
MTSLEFVPINFEIPAHVSVCRNSGASEKSVGQIEAGDNQKHCKEEASSTKHGDHSERIDVWPGC